MQLIEFIFSNPLFIIIILGLINFLFSKGKEKEQEKRPRKIEREQPRQPVPPIREHIPKVEVEQTVQHVEREEQLSIEELRQQQLARLTSEIQGISEQESEQDHIEQQRLSDTKQINVTTAKFNKNHNMKKRLQGQLTKKGLMNSIIMAEVLGPPRAKNRYKSVQMRRHHSDI